MCVRGELKIYLYVYPTERLYHLKLSYSFYLYSFLKIKIKSVLSFFLSILETDDSDYG